MESMFYLCSRQFSQTQNLNSMLHCTDPQRKKAQMASALDTFRQCADWDDLTCSEQMRIEDLVGC